MTTIKRCHDASSVDVQGARQEGESRLKFQRGAKITMPKPSEQYRRNFDRIFKPQDKHEPA